MKKILILIFLLSFTLSGYSQFIMRHKVVEPRKADTTDISYYSKKRAWLAASEIVGINLGVWAFDRYIQKADFAYIDIHTIRDNFKSGFKWDNDQMGTNLFLHPYHGSIYFNSARSNGYNFWESGTFAFGGSLMWEMFMENESPSINDIIATPVGGLAMGEVFYRTSDMILDDTRKGRNRVWREFAAFLVSPTRGLTRIITGDAWKRRPTTGRQFGIPEVSVEISTGVRFLELRDNIFDKGTGMATDISVEYGDKFDNDNVKPYDYFSFRTNLNIHSSQPLLGQMNIIGRLWGIDIADTKNDYWGFGFFQHFDYYDSDTISSVSNRVPYKFATPASAGIGLLHKSKRLSNWQVDSYAYFNGIILGAALSDHYVVDNRNYNLGSGFGWKSGVNIAYKDIIGISWLYEGYRMFTWKGYPDGYQFQFPIEKPEEELDAQGDRSNATLNTMSLKIDLKLRNNIYLTAIGSGYRRSTRYYYSEYEDVYSLTAEGRLMLTYKF